MAPGNTGWKFKKAGDVCYLAPNPSRYVLYVGDDHELNRWAVVIYIMHCLFHFSLAFRFSLMVCLSESLAAFETGDYLWLRMIIFRICQPLLVCQCAQSKCWFLVIPQIIYDKWPQYLIFWLLLLDFLISKCKHGKGLILSIFFFFLWLNYFCLPR